MRILWVCNIVLPAIAEKLNIDHSSREGWLSGAAEKMLDPEEKSGIELGICFPYSGEENDVTVTFDNGSSVRCFGFDEDLKNPQKYDPALESRFGTIINTFSPDMIHIFGTEFPHTLACARAWGKPERLLIGIQGLCGPYSEHYMAGMPLSVQRFATLRDIIKHDSLKDQLEKFRKRGRNEAEALKLTDHVSGRTAWDKTETEKINPNAEYHFMNETMRSCFYKDSWNGAACVPHSIFQSQGDYPIKGLHYMLEAMPKILERFPDAMLYVAGNNVIRSDTFKERLKISEYGHYLLGLIKKEQIGDHVVMLGMLEAEQMKAQYLASNVFVCPSEIENSPNSLGEAMLLGVPCVASDVGGIPDLMINGQDGIVYPSGDVGRLSDAVIEIFSKDDVSRLYSISAKKHAYATHDPEVNFRRMLEIYSDIVNDSADADTSDGGRHSDTAGIINDADTVDGSTRE